MSTTETEARLYKSAVPNISVISTKGKIAEFRGHQFITRDPEMIAYLDAEVAVNGFSGAIFIDPNARTITAEQENPMLALKKKFFEQFQAERAAQVDPAQDLGSSDQGRLKPASTSDIAPVAMGAGPRK